MKFNTANEVFEAMRSVGVEPAIIGDNTELTMGYMGGDFYVAVEGDIEEAAIKMRTIEGLSVSDYGKNTYGDTVIFIY